MSRTTRVMECSVDDVWAVLADPWTYGMWVVGSARIRDVEEHWPDAGALIHHSVGAWPFLVSDSTKVERVDPPHFMQLLVRAWPAGEGRVALTVRPNGEGHTEVVMDEEAVSGPAKLIPQRLMDPILHARNVEALRRLAYIAEHRGRSETQRSTTPGPSH